MLGLARRTTIIVGGVFLAVLPLSFAAVPAHGATLPKSAGRTHQTNAYNKNSQSRELYSFVKSMETLEKSLDSTTNIVLKTDNELFKFLKKP